MPIDPAAPEQPSADDPPPDQQVAMLRTMYRIRALEETLDRLFAEGRVHGTMHLSVGQEGTAAGAIGALRPTDYLLSTHRGHGHAVAKGAELRGILAEFLGRDDGYCHGLGGSMHIAAPAIGYLGANGIVAGGIALAVGVALGVKLRGWDRVVLDVFGDGATNEGGFHEALNLAAVWDLPVVFVCENNQYGISMPIGRAVRIARLAERAAAYGMPGVTVDGNQALRVHAAVRAAVDRARSGGGPSLVECVTYRWKGHSKSDQNRYRTREEIDAWKRRDPILQLRRLLVGRGLLDDARADALAAAEDAAVQAALAEAEAGPEPAFERVLASVYA